MVERFLWREKQLYQGLTEVSYGDDPYALYQEKIMLKRLVMIGLVGISLTTILAAKVNAQIAGWAGFGFSEFTFVVALKEVKDPTKFSLRYYPLKAR